ncbi:MAG: penicillin-binding protein 2 [Turicibacter sp.]|nr:penicillin-binding protein 2 [Turicibacter sp.]
MFEELSRKMKSLTFRIQVLKGICVFLMGLLAFRLYEMQVVYSQEYVDFLDQSTTTRISLNVPRGRIYDRNLEILVDNDAVHIITYTYSTSIGQSTMRKLADELARILESVALKEGTGRMEEMNNGLRTRDLRDLWLVTHPKEAEELVGAWLKNNADAALGLLGDQELLDRALINPKVLSDSQFYAVQLSTVTDDMLNTLTPRQRASQVIFNAMNQGVHGAINIVLNRATQEEIWEVAENLRKLPGFDIGTSWERDFPSPIGFSGIYGRVTTYEQGLPSEQAQRLRALGYRNNDRVGRGQLEGALEPILSGVNSIYDVTVENGASFRTPVFEGQPGMNVSLTLDSRLQEKVDEILKRQLERSRSQQATAEHLREGYAVMLNPRTGEILSMNGMVRTRQEEEEGDGAYEWVANPLGTIQSQFEMGSTVKGAALLLGYQEGATQIGQDRFDQPLLFPGSNPMGSWRNLGTVSDLDALMYSSNVYFWLQTIAMGGGAYSANNPNGIGISEARQQELLGIHREFFGQFGLGSGTGIELPEATGLRNSSSEFFNLLFYAIGQSDTFTTMQLAQYAMTLANGGSRFATQLVKDIYLPSTNGEDMRLYQAFTPRLLNRIDLDQAYFERVREGFRRAVQDSRGTGFSAFSGADYDPAGKTGTAQTILLDESGWPVRPAVEVHNVTFVGWAPVNDPEVAIAVILPAGELPANGRSGSWSNNTAQIIANEAMKAYFDLKRGANNE